jgi:hypothetical protein
MSFDNNRMSLSMKMRVETMKIPSKSKSDIFPSISDSLSLTKSPKMFKDTIKDNALRTPNQYERLSGSLDFMFDRKSIFKISMTGVDIEELELYLIDSGMEEMEEDGEGNLLISASFTDFGNMQKALEDKKIEILNAELQRIPTTYVELNEEQEAEINLLLDGIENGSEFKNYNLLKTNMNKLELLESRYDLLRLKIKKKVESNS